MALRLLSLPVAHLVTSADPQRGHPLPIPDLDAAACRTAQQRIGQGSRFPFNVQLDAAPGAQAFGGSCWKAKSIIADVGSRIDSYQ